MECGLSGKECSRRIEEQDKLEFSRKEIAVALSKAKTPYSKLSAIFGRLERKEVKMSAALLQEMRDICDDGSMAIVKIQAPIRKPEAKHKLVHL